MWPGPETSAIESCPEQDRKSTRLNSSHTVIYTLSLHDALPILLPVIGDVAAPAAVLIRPDGHVAWAGDLSDRELPRARSEEHTSELQSHSDLHSFPTRRSSDLAPGHRRRRGTGGRVDPSRRTCGLGRRPQRSRAAPS